MRTAFGIFYLLFGTLFVCINAYVLASGAFQVGSHQWEKIALATFGGGLAFYLAAQTITLSEMFRTVRLFWIVPVRVPHVSTLLLWLLFLCVNLVTGLGTIGHARNASIATSQKQQSTVSRTEEARGRLKSELAGIPQHRPTATVDAEIAKEKLTKAYLNSSDCTDANTKDRRASCQRIEALAAELASAKKADEINAKLAELDERLDDTGPVVEAAAATQVNSLHRLVGRYGISEDQINTGISVMWPIALEAGAAYSWHQAFMLLGLSMAAGAPRRKKAAEVAENAETPPAANSGPAKAIPAPVAHATITTDELRRQADLARYFFSQRIRKLPAGAMPEREWYSYYESLCQRQRMRPIIVEQFRRLAQNHGITVETINGEPTYRGYLPVGDA